jgi:hypothetical protein
VRGSGGKKSGKGGMDHGGREGARGKRREV